VTDQVRDLVKKIFVTYVFITDEAHRLLGIVTFRDLLMSEGSAKMSDIMLRNPFHLTPTLPVMDAMKLVLNRHYPIYPVCDEVGKLIGLVRGQAMFEEQAYEISAQAGTMVGVQKEERLLTPWPTSLRFRHPWLQLNLLTAFLAAAVVGLFTRTIDALPILAVFMPIVAGMGGNAATQTLTVIVRGIALGELSWANSRKALLKEAVVGIGNGVVLGLVAAAVAWATRGDPVLGLVLGSAMVINMFVAATAGVLIPLGLRASNIDPALASSVFITTLTDVFGFFSFLGLATIFARYLTATG
jgi:magnesium transporter